MDINCLVNITKTYGIDMTKIKCAIKDCSNCMDEGQFVGSVCTPCYIRPQPTKALLLSAQQIRDMCVKYGWDDSYQSLKAYRTVEDMSLELNQLEK